MKTFGKLIELAVALAIAVIILLTVPTIALHSHWGKEKIKKVLTNWAKTQGITITVEDVQVTFPFEIKVVNIQGEVQDEEFSIDSISCELALLNLVRGEVFLRSLEAQNFSFDNLPTLDLKGEAKIGRAFACDLTIIQKEITAPPLRIVLDLQQKRGNFLVDIKAQVSQLTLPLKALTISTNEATLQLHLSAPKSTFKELLENREQKFPINGLAQIAFLNVKAGKYISPNLVLTSNFTLFTDLSLSIKSLFLKSDLFQGKFQGNFNKHLTFEKGEGSIASSTLQGIIGEEVKGNLTLDGIFEKEKIDLTLLISPLYINPYTIKEIKGKFVGSMSRKQLKGNLSVTINALNEILQFKSDVFALFQNEWRLPNITLTSPQFKGKGSFILDNAGLITGEGSLQVENINTLIAPLQLGKINAAANIDAIFTKEKGVQNLTLLANVNEIYFDDFYGTEGNATLHLADPFTNPKGDISINLANFSYKDINFDAFSFKSSNFSENWPFTLKLNGEWSNPINILSSGFWRYKPGDLVVNVQELNGEIFGNPFNNAPPIAFELTKEKLSFKGINLTFANSSISGEGEFSSKKNEAKIVLQHLPIDFLSLNPLDLTIGGFVTMEANFTQKKSLEGSVTLLLEDGKVLPLGENIPLKCAGVLNAIYKGEKFKLSSKMRLGENQPFEFNTELPVDLSLFPFKFKLHEDKELFANLFFAGKIEDIADFFDLGANDIEGKVNCHISLSQTFKNPKIDGVLNLSDTIYENYHTGTYVEDLKGQIIASNEKVILTFLQGRGEKSGEIYATGELSLDRKSDYPFDFSVKVDSIKGLDTNLVEMIISGSARLHGNIKDSKAFGEFTVSRGKMSIPEKIKMSTPILQFTYVNEKKTKPLKLQPYKYPPKLDITINSADHIIIEGRGLYSEWKGGAKIGGDMEAPLIFGKLNMNKGSFAIAGKTFRISEGKLIFDGQANEIPKLSIFAKTIQKGVTITASLKGPLNSPQLTFESIPPLSIGSIVSLLIFGQDLSDISGIQAVQLAHVVATMTEGNDLLEPVRKSLGIDRLSIVSYPTATQEPGKVVIQTGKYTTHGITFSVSQGNEQGNSNVAVEVDPGIGLILRGETEEQREEGKFTLKWNYNY